MARATPENLTSDRKPAVRLTLPGAPFILLAAALGCLWLLRPAGLPAAPHPSSPPSPAHARTLGAMHEVDYRSLTRGGETWRLAAASLAETGDGIDLAQPRLGVLREGRILAAVRADEGRLEDGGSRLRLAGQVELRVGGELLILAAEMVLQADGQVAARGPARVRTPHGEETVSMVRLLPAEGKVVLNAGLPDEATQRWPGWGLDLIRLGESCRSGWGAMRSGEAPVQRAYETIRER